MKQLQVLIQRIQRTKCEVKQDLCTTKHFCHVYYEDNIITTDAELTVLNIIVEQQSKYNQEYALHRGPLKSNFGNKLLALIY